MSYRISYKQFRKSKSVLTVCIDAPSSGAALGLFSRLYPFCHPVSIDLLA